MRRPKDKDAWRRLVRVKLKPHYDGMDMANKKPWPPEFWNWLEENEHVYRRFCAMALDIHKRGFDTYSAQAIFEVIRWETDIREGPEGESNVKVNNNARPYISRVCWGENHDLPERFFRFRKLYGVTHWGARIDDEV